MRTTTILLLTAGLILLAGCGRPTDQGQAASDTNGEYDADSLGTIDADDSSPVDAPSDHVAVPPSVPADRPGDGTNITDSAPADRPADPPQTTVHTAEKGDTFWNLAVKYYGDGQEWKRIAEANPGVKMNAISVGTKIVIPRD